jgi:hypothetical protein
MELQNLFGVPVRVQSVPVVVLTNQPNKNETAKTVTYYEFVDLLNKLNLPETLHEELIQKCVRVHWVTQKKPTRIQIRNSSHIGLNELESKTQDLPANVLIPVAEREIRLQTLIGYKLGKKKLHGQVTIFNDAILCTRDLSDSVQSGQFGYEALVLLRADLQIVEKAAKEEKKSRSSTKQQVELIVSHVEATHDDDEHEERSEVRSITFILLLLLVYLIYVLFIFIVI